MDGNAFIAGFLATVVFVLLLCLCIAASANTTEARIAESCEISGSFVVDGVAYKCEPVK